MPVYPRIHKSLRTARQTDPDGLYNPSVHRACSREWGFCSRAREKVIVRPEDVLLPHQDTPRARSSVSTWSLPFVLQ
jgi:hypothetical protein